MRKLIKVTRSCISQGNQENLTSCPIAIASCNQFNLIPGTVRVFEYAICGLDGSDEIPLPRSAQRFIKKFDKYGKKGVKPFNFYIEMNNE